MDRRLKLPNTVRREGGIFSGGKRFSIEVDFDEIATRKNMLERTRTELKIHFVGIEDTIDSLLDYIQIWYLLPKILTRPNHQSSQ